MGEPEYLLHEVQHAQIFLFLDLKPFFALVT